MIDPPTRRQRIEAHPLYVLLSLIDPILWDDDQAHDGLNKNTERLRAARAEVERILLLAAGPTEADNR